jgi:UDP-N-acetylglucosamine--N-acetylmuramyl-(pentapeptide) pyrophosphoryl-undecaprenol N-acetylglucosamine transferase
VHQTGSDDRERVAAAYAEHGMQVTVVDFESNMPTRYHWADLAICRAGSQTLAELALASLPALLIPYPFAADDHQTVNAREVEVAGAARLLQGLGLAGERAELLFEAIASLVASPEALVAMSAAAQKRARPDAAQQIVDECARSLGASGGS